MITASDLMIGNYIISGNNGKYDSDMIIGRVLEIGNEDRDFEQIYCECEESYEWFFKDNYFGIPLTQVWLDKFGFKYLGGANLIEFNAKWFYGNIHIEQLKSGEFVFHGQQIMYVHQLQNLYFLLTGKKIILKKQ